MIFNYFNMGFTLFGVNNNKKETKLDHFIYETKLAVLICPKNFTENSINPDVFYRLKKLYNIKTINMFDRIKGVNKDIIITDHINRSGLSFLVGKTPYKSKPMFPDISKIYIKEKKDLKNVVHTIGPQNYQKPLTEKGVIFSESIAPVSTVWHYVGVRVRAHGISNVENKTVLKFI